MSFNEKIRKIWKDPVLSKVISAGFIALLGLLYALISKFNINSPCSWGFMAIISVILFVIFRYILKMIIFHEDRPNSILTSNTEPIQELVEDVEGSKQDDIKDKASNEREKHEYNWLDSDILFAQCIAHTFPGNRGIVWYNSSDAVRRLNLFFENLRKEEPNGDAAWWRRGHQAFSVKNAEILDVDKIYLGNDRFKISRMAVFVSPNYYKHFIYIEAEAEPATGLYPKITKVQIKEATERGDYITEEYGEFNGRLISRQEYDDGASIYESNVIQHNGDAILRIRYLTRINFILTSKNSPYNNQRFEVGSVELFRDALSDKKSTHKLFEFMDTFQKIDKPGHR